MPILTYERANDLILSLWYANGALNILTDLMVAALPMKTIWSLQMAQKQKLALTAILTLGWLYV
jgi:hypothetical protein